MKPSQVLLAVASIAWADQEPAVRGMPLGHWPSDRGPGLLATIPHPSARMAARMSIPLYFLPFAVATGIKSSRPAVLH